LGGQKNAIFGGRHLISMDGVLLNWLRVER